MKTWLISDTHFGHSNILTFKKGDGSPLREFLDVFHMDFHMMTTWNSVVKPEDKVYHLGDVGFKNFTYLKRIFDELNGRKILIKGNHDNFKLSQYQQIFADIRAYHVLDGILLGHIPVHPDALSKWKGQIHGHTHSFNMEDQRYYNVSVEVIDYIPVDFEVIREYFDELSSKK